MRALVVSNVCFYREGVARALRDDGIETSVSDHSIPEIAETTALVDVVLVDLVHEGLARTLELTGGTRPVVGLALTADPPVAAAATLGIRAFVGCDQTLAALIRDPAANAANGLGGALFCSADLGTGVRPCPPCPTEPWVVLAGIVGDADGNLQIDNQTYRRYVASFGAFGFSCGLQPLVVSPNLWTTSQQDVLAAHLDPSAIESLHDQHGGSIEAVTELAASSIKGVSRRSALGRFVGSSTIADVANTSRKAFVTDAVSGGVQAKRAGELWDTIRKIVKTADPMADETGAPARSCRSQPAAI